jgi:hypothetical protein
MNLNEDVRTLLIKILVPATIGVSMKLAIEGRDKAMTKTNVITSFILGVGTAYLTGALILKSFSPEIASIVIGIVAMGSESIAKFMIRKFKIDSMIISFLEYLLGQIKK